MCLFLKLLQVFKRGEEVLHDFIIPLIKKLDLEEELFEVAIKLTDTEKKTVSELYDCYLSMAAELDDGHQAFKFTLNKVIDSAEINQSILLGILFKINMNEYCITEFQDA